MNEQVGPENLLGALIFWGYIAAALLFTGLIFRDIIVAYRKSCGFDTARTKFTNDTIVQREKAQVFIAAAILSFSVLSYHMLYFLVDSYMAWAINARVTLPRHVLGENGIVHIRHHKFGIEPWRWSKASTLFQDFAQIICDDPKRFWWTLQSLLYSFGWNIFMSIEGTRQQVPHLWAYFVLDQILPVSFTQNLFCAAIFLSPSSAARRELVPAPKAVQLITLLGYSASLAVAPQTINTPWYLLTLFTTRILLFAPYLLLRPTALAERSEVSVGHSRSLFGFKVLGLGLSFGLFLVQSWKAAPPAEAWGAIKSSHAVAALGYDYAIGLISLCIFVFKWKDV